MFFYPNRPTLIPPDPKNPLKPKPAYLNSLEATGLYVCEHKWNGDNVVITTGPNPVFRNRRGEPFRYRPTAEVLKELRLWPPKCDLNAELVHYHTKSTKNLIIVHSVLVWKGKPLYGKTWGDARQLLEANQDLFGTHVRLSTVWKDHFWDHFQEADGETIEGIVLKNPKGKLVLSASLIPDVPWMLKVRKPSKKYSF